MRTADRETFGATLPYLSLPTHASIIRATVAGDDVRLDSERRLDLQFTDQEFTLFRGLHTPADVTRFAARFGWLGIGNATPTDAASWTASERPLWFRLLSNDPGRMAYFQAEPVVDWIRQAGLMDLAYGLLGLLRLPRTQRVLLEALTQRRRGSEGPAYKNRWPAVLVLDGASRAGLRVLADLHHDMPRVVVAPWRRPYWLDQGGRTLRFDLSRPGIEEALRDLLNPWLYQVRAGLLEVEGKTAPSLNMPVSLLALMWFQVANAMLSEVPPRVCAWERCPGPPERPQVFLWRWGTGVKHRDAQFCHPRCRSAKAQATHRASPAYRRDKGER
jgi:hypothetical protein